MPKIFISYRRTDSRTFTDRIHDRLVEVFGADSVFQDVDDIPPGADFRVVLREAVESCDIVLVMIGPQWASVTDGQGRKRLFNTADFVRIEVQTALTTNKLVIPVLIEGASPPTIEKLPDSLHELAYRNAITVRHNPDFSRDMERLVKQIRHYEDQLVRRREAEEQERQRQAEMEAQARVEAEKRERQRVAQEQAQKNVDAEELERQRLEQEAIIQKAQLTAESVKKAPNRRTKQKSSTRQSQASATYDTPDFDAMTLEDKMLWIESLARRQGANVEEFTTSADVEIPEIDPKSVVIDEPGYIPPEGSKAAKEILGFPSHRPATSIERVNPFSAWRQNTVSSTDNQILSAPAPKPMPASTSTRQNPSSYSPKQATQLPASQPTTESPQTAPLSEPKPDISSAHNQSRLRLFLKPRRLLVAAGLIVLIIAGTVIIPIIQKSIVVGDTRTIGIMHNADWTPVEQDVNGVSMVKVPSGCFVMGSTSGFDDELPLTRVCFEEEFWIDKTEVTNDQFAEFDGKAMNASNRTDANHPREKITWFEAHDFCTLRGGRLPTEAEWEYVARGPDNLTYPWGNDFVADNVMYSGNSNRQTAAVGSKPTGASWVGALDMSGNVWEWVSTLYKAYPYPTPGSNTELQQWINSNDTRNGRTLRGGAWYFSNTDFLRAADRTWNYPNYSDFNIGFRCVVSVPVS